MAKVKLYTDEIREVVKKEYRNTTCIFITNLNSIALRFLFNGVERVLPGYDSEADLGNPPIFEFSCNGHYFDAIIYFNQSNNDALVDYSELIEEEEHNNNCKYCKK